MALLGDPATLILDDPVNGLDPEGVVWMRQLARRLAAEGRTVFLSSHLMSEMAQTADHIIILGRGRIIADVPGSEMLSGAERNSVQVRTPQVTSLTQLLEAEGATVSRTDSDTVSVAGLTASRIAEIAAGAGVAIYGLTPVTRTLEDATWR